MPEAAVTTGAGAGSGAGAGAGNPGGGAAPTSGAGAGSGGADISKGSGAGSGTGAGAEGDKGAAAPPKSIKLTYDDGDEPFELSLEDEAAEAAPTDTEFKFDQLEAIKDSNPDLYKTLKSELSKGSRFTKLTGFKSPEEAKAHVDRVNKLSTALNIEGKQGMDAVENALSGMSSDIVRFQEGDAPTIERWFKENTVGMSTAAAAVADQWFKSDPQAAIGYVAKQAWTALATRDASGRSAIEAFEQAFAANKDPDVKKLLERVAQTLNGIGENSQYKPDPMVAVKAKQQTVAQREHAVWSREATNEVMPIVRTAARRALSQIATSYNKDFTADQRAEYNEILVNDFQTRMSKDSDAQARLKEISKNEDTDGFIKLVKSIRAKHMNEAVKDLIRKKILDKKSIREEAAGKTETGSGSGAGNAGAKAATKYTGAINPRTGSPAVDFDYARMSSEDAANPNGDSMLMQRTFYIKGRKEKFVW